ncbi:hypothetical protein K438DRAFT_2032358 [Mycena galopus ATCC 62051]|nr:hypothetical protein K438DRAFT_2032358 [Mycena galopus ATCC 62051]
MGHEVTSAIVYVLEKEFPYLSLCSNHWKAKRVIAGRYQFWAKTQGLAENGDGSDVDSDDERTVGPKHKTRAATVPRKRQRPAVVPPAQPLSAPLPAPAPAPNPVPAPAYAPPAPAPNPVPAPAPMLPAAPAPAPAPAPNAASASGDKP